MEPPILGLCQLQAEIIIVLIGGAHQQGPVAAELVSIYAWLRLSHKRCTTPRKLDDSMGAMGTHRPTSLQLVDGIAV